MIESVEQYVAMVESENAGVRRSAITESADKRTWSYILTKRPDLAADIAMNKHLPKSIIDCLMVTACTRVRSLIAMKRSLTKEQFEQLAGDEDDSVRIMIANNKKTPQYILEKLLYDASDRVSDAARVQIQNHGDTY